MSTIEIKKVTKRFGDFTAVKDADLSVGPGEVVCLLGPSGCGKTTTLRMIAGLERATSGDVIIAGQRMNELSPEKRDIAMVFQFYALYPALSVGQNIAMPLHYEKLSKDETDKRVMNVARIMHLTDVLDRMPGQISEGEKQRLAVARAIVRDPNCFLFDEPLSRLDVELRHSMRGQIKEVLTGLSKATVIVTHDQLEALTMANRIAIMRDGLIEQVGTPHEVFAKPANVFVASFIGTPQMNLVEADLQELRQWQGRRAPGRQRHRDCRRSGRLAAEAVEGHGRHPAARLHRRIRKAKRHHRRPGRTDRADGCRNPDPRPHVGRRRNPCRRPARHAGEDRRGPASPPRSQADPFLR